jgi:phage shock protein PspC (stress-responsive transcriptional regulator)
MLKNIKRLIEWQMFGVCTALGKKMGISIQRIRMWFIYISFFTLGSPIIIYFVMAFWREMKNYMNMARRNPAKWF